MKDTWIKQGYIFFAEGGPFALKIERISKAINKNKSGFYHYFSDLGIFTDKLLEYHLSQAKVMAIKEAECESIDELIDVLIFHQTDLLFNRQLRIHRENPSFFKCFEKTAEITTPGIMGLWTKTLGLDRTPHLAALIMKLGLENFYLQITPETLNTEWLHGYFNEFKKLVREFKIAKGLTLPDVTV